MESFTEVDDVDETAPAMAAETAEVAADDTLAEEDGHAGIAAAAAVGTAAAVMGAAAGDEDTDENLGELAADDLEEVAAVEEMETGGEESDELPASIEHEAETAEDTPDPSDKWKRYDDHKGRKRRKSLAG